MISVRLTDVKVDYDDMLSHCPVAQVPNARQFLERFINLSAATYVGYIKDEVACMYGLKPPSFLSTSQTYMWLITTDVVDWNKFEFIRHSEVVIGNVLKEYEKIIGETYVKDTRAFKWLRWLGAVHLDYVGELVPFYITRDSFKERRKGRWLTL